MEVSRWFRTSLPLAAICARREAQFGWPGFVIDAGVALQTVDDLRLELKQVPFDPRRELWANMLATPLDEGWGFTRRWDDALDAVCEPAARYRFEDNYYLRSALAIDAFAAALQQPFQLTEPRYDCETDNEWCMVETDDVVVHVSHAYRMGTYHEWQPKRCPPRCNHWIDIRVKAAAPAALDRAWRVGWRQCWIEALQELGRGQVHTDPDHVAAGHRDRRAVSGVGLAPRASTARGRAPARRVTLGLMAADSELLTLDAWIATPGVRREEIARRIGIDHGLEFEALAPFRRSDLPLASYFGLDRLFRFELGGGTNPGARCGIHGPPQQPLRGAMPPP